MFCCLILLHIFNCWIILGEKACWWHLHQQSSIWSQKCRGWRCWITKRVRLDPHSSTKCLCLQGDVGLVTKRRPWRWWRHRLWVGAGADMSGCQDCGHRNQDQDKYWNCFTSWSSSSFSSRSKVSKIILLLSTISINLHESFVILYILKTLKTKSQ